MQLTQADSQPDMCRPLPSFQYARLSQDHRSGRARTGITAVTASGPGAKSFWAKCRVSQPARSPIKAHLDPAGSCAGSACGAAPAAGPQLPGDRACPPCTPAAADQAEAQHRVDLCVADIRMPMIRLCQLACSPLCMMSLHPDDGGPGFHHPVASCPALRGCALPLKNPMMTPQPKESILATVDVQGL